ncbi:hypothetical protein [Pseudomonas sp. CGJS7]|uniref:hypothetical protein n=1 Tax=Pseudomonas sp. CGJS7 TaxID=3109348 RepID=UPI003007FAEA
MPTENRSNDADGWIACDDGLHLIQMDKNLSHYGWVFRKVDGGLPYSVREATPHEMAHAQARQHLRIGVAQIAGQAPAPQPHPEPIAWMVGTAIWWTKEEAERDTAAAGLPIVGLGPMTDPGEVERLRSIERSYGLREALLEQVKGERDRMIARTMELSGQLADQDALLHKLKETLQREYWDEYAGLDETRELIDVALSASSEPSAPDKQGSSLGAVRAPDIQDLLDRAATAIGQYGDSLLGRGQREDSVDLLDLEREVRDLEQEFKGAFALPSR